VGGLANKNPAPLLEAVRLLGEPVQLWLYGPTDGLDRSASELERMGRLRVVGALVEPDLPGFYHSLDCVVHTETFAGWANLAAEALACGVPLICTPHGTLAFANHEITALVMREPTPGAIAAAITRLRTDSALARSLARNGRQVISRFSWRKYSESLVAMFDQKQD
jgi:glycosyltransferase involved in cell wall biosynthesis